MRADRPTVFQHGPFWGLAVSQDGDVELAHFLQALPPDEPAIWLDSARPHPITGRWSALAWSPWLRLAAHGARLECRTSRSIRRFRAHPLRALQQLMARYRIPRGRGPLASALSLWGFFSYELNGWIERLPLPQPGPGRLPELSWWGMRCVVLVDHLEGCHWLVSLADPHQPQRAARRQAEDQLAWMDALPHTPPRTVEAAGRAVGTLRATCSPVEFEAMVRQALDEIRRGEIFQANLAHRFTAPWRGSPLRLAAALRRVNPSPFACVLRAEDLAVVSCSPERLVRVAGDRVETRPIAGTRPRGASAADDAVNGLELLISEKERAEHLMLVDLERNDLGRICRTGTVVVDELMALEHYSHVIHIVSNVSGQRRRGVSAMDIVAALFPGGTITGCPKVRCMELLRELEPVRRGLYTGSLGRLGFDGTLDLNIAIRTMVIQDGELSFHVGAGIVADSDPAREHQETLHKAGALLEALRGVAQPPADPAESHAVSR